jgi:hypothetical protein
VLLASKWLSLRVIPARPVPPWTMIPLTTNLLTRLAR